MLVVSTHFTANVLLVEHSTASSPGAPFRHSLAGGRRAWKGGAVSGGGGGTGAQGSAAPNDPAGTIATAGAARRCTDRSFRRLRA